VPSSAYSPACCRRAVRAGVQRQRRHVPRQPGERRAQQVRLLGRHQLPARFIHPLHPFIRRVSLRSAGLCRRLDVRVLPRAVPRRVYGVEFGAALLRVQARAPRRRPVREELPARWLRVERDHQARQACCSTWCTTVGGASLGRSAWRVATASRRGRSSTTSATRPVRPPTRTIPLIDTPASSAARASASKVSDYRLIR